MLWMEQSGGRRSAAVAREPPPRARPETGFMSCRVGVRRSVKKTLVYRETK